LNRTSVCEEAIFFNGERVFLEKAVLVLESAERYGEVREPRGRGMSTVGSRYHRTGEDITD
jgi:hypothetical protein